VHSIRPTDITVIEGIAGGPLLAVRGANSLCFYGFIFNTFFNRFFYF
jgi:hypothetical protein